MTDHNNAGNYYDDLEVVLGQVLGSPSLSSAQRQRIISRALRDPSRPHLSRLIVRVSVAVGTLILLVLALGWMLVRPGASDGVDAAQSALNVPAPGQGRHVVMTVHIGVAIDAPRSWNTEIWQRTLPDGTAQLEIEATSPDGLPLARLVSSGDTWAVAAGDDVEIGRGTPLIVPPELSGALISPTSLLAQLSSVPAERVQERREDNLLILSADVSDHFPPDARKGVEARLGLPVAAFRLEVSVDEQAEQLRSWREVVIDSRGGQHTFRQLTFVTWEDTDSVAIDDQHFALPDPNEEAVADGDTPFPDQIVTPVGDLVMTSTTTEDDERSQVTYLGPQQLVIQIERTPTRADRIELPSNGVHHAEVDGTSVLWQEDVQYRWPRVAIWDDGQHRYNLSVLAGGPDAWSEADLLALVRALSR